MENLHQNEIPKDEFVFANAGERITDKRLEEKPVGFLKDTWIRFRGNRASVAATVIILLVILYAFLAPLLITSHDAKFMDSMYAKKPGRVGWLRDTFGLLDGGVERDFSEKNLILTLGIGVAAEDQTGKGSRKLHSAMESPYQPMRKVGQPKTFLDPTRQEVTVYPGRVDTYLEVGFVYRDIEQHRLQEILAWQEASGKPLLYPLIEDNEWCADIENANYW